MTSLLILGAGGHAQVIAETAQELRRFARIAFLDDENAQRSVLGLPVLGPLASAFDSTIVDTYRHVLVGLGDSELRLGWMERLVSCGYQFPSLIHPSAWISPSAHIGAGTVVFAQAVVNAQVRIGKGAIINTGCSVDHHVCLEDGVHICPGARLAGGVHVGARSWIGIGASVIQHVRIGAHVTVGAGAAVVHDLSDGVTAVGVPARPR